MRKASVKPAARVELHVTDAALDDEIAHGEAGQLALAMRQRDRRRRGKAREIGRLQIPMQRLFEPEDPVRLDGAGKFDAVRQVIGRIHVEHQQGLIADRSAHRIDPLCFFGHGAGAGLELHRPVAELEKPRQLLAVIGVGRIRPVVSAGGIGEDRPVLAAEQPVYRQAGGFALDVPQGDVDSGDRRHYLGAGGARDGRRQAVFAFDAARPRRGQREQLLPHRSMSQRAMPRMISPNRLTHSQIRGIGAP